MAQLVKNLPANEGDAGDMGSIPGLGRPLEKEMATHSSILAWEIPWRAEPGGLQSMGLQNVRYDSVLMYTHTEITLSAIFFLERKKCRKHISLRHGLEGLFPISSPCLE